MRAGPLSDPRVISLLNRYFAPVYVSNEDFGKAGAAEEDEKKACTRIYLEALMENRPAGSVCVYLIAPGGDGFDSLVVSQAAEPGRLQKMLEAAIERLKTLPGEPLVPPSPQSA